MQSMISSSDFELQEWSMSTSKKEVLNLTLIKVILHLIKRLKKRYITYGHLFQQFAFI